MRAKRGSIAVLVEAVTDLVHDREERVVLERVAVARRQADVGDVDGRCRTGAPSGRAGRKRRRRRRRARPRPRRRAAPPRRTGPRTNGSSSPGVALGDDAAELGQRARRRRRRSSPSAARARRRRRSTSYGSSYGAKHSIVRRCRSSIRSRRAGTGVVVVGPRRLPDASPSEAARLVSAASSTGIRRACSWSRRATRTTLAANDSGGTDASIGGVSLDQLAERGSSSRACARPRSVPSCCARAASPPRRHHHLQIPLEQPGRVGDVRDLAEPGRSSSNAGSAGIRAG